MNLIGRSVVQARTALAVTPLADTFGSQFATKRHDLPAGATACLDSDHTTPPPRATPDQALVLIVVSMALLDHGIRLEKRPGATT